MTTLPLLTHAFPSDSRPATGSNDLPIKRISFCLPTRTKCSMSSTMEEAGRDQQAQQGGCDQPADHGCCHGGAKLLSAWPRPATGGIIANHHGQWWS